MKSLIELFNNLCELYKELPELTKNLIYLFPIFTLLWSSCVLWYDKLKHLAENHMSIFLITFLLCLSFTLFCFLVSASKFISKLRHKKTFFPPFLYAHNVAFAIKTAHPVCDKCNAYLNEGGCNNYYCPHCSTIYTLPETTTPKKLSAEMRSKILSLYSNQRY